jgi:hypothetical protein
MRRRGHEQFRARRNDRRRLHSFLARRIQTNGPWINFPGPTKCLVPSRLHEEQRSKRLRAVSRVPEDREEVRLAV